MEVIGIEVNAIGIIKRQSNVLELGTTLKQVGHQLVAAHVWSGANISQDSLKEQRCAVEEVGRHKAQQGHSQPKQLQTIT